MKDYDGNSKGCCFVRFVDGINVPAAEALSGTDLGGRKIFVEMTRPKEEREQFYGKNFNDNGDGSFVARKPYPVLVNNDAVTVFIGNLSFNTDADQLKEFFGPCGNMKDVRIGKTPDGTSRGFAHICFENAEGVEKAVACAGRELNGRALNINGPKKAGEGGGRGGRGGGGRGGGGGSFRGNSSSRGGKPGDEGANARQGNIDFRAQNVSREC